MGKVWTSDKQIHLLKEGQTAAHWLRWNSEDVPIRPVPQVEKKRYTWEIMILSLYHTQTWNTNL